MILIKGSNCQIHLKVFMSGNSQKEKKEGKKGPGKCWSFSGWCPRVSPNRAGHHAPC